MTKLEWLGLFNSILLIAVSIMLFSEMTKEQPVIKCEREPIVKYYDMDTEKSND